MELRCITRRHVPEYRQACKKVACDDCIGTNRATSRCATFAARPDTYFTIAIDSRVDAAARPTGCATGIGRGCALM
jgi:hypothetical protein